jgi:predicted amidohydrolase YtcJ
MSDTPRSIRLTNARIYRSAQDCNPADTLVVSHGAVLFVGSPDDAPDAETTIDMRGATVIPGLTDAHVHLFAIAAERLQIAVDPSAVRSIPDLLERVSSAAQGAARGHWLRGVGFDENRLPEHRYPTREELDAAAPHHPLVIRRFCGHTAVVNSAALSAMEIGEGTGDPDGGSYGRDSAGRLNGIARESAAEAIFRRMPPIDRVLLANSVRATIADGIGLGLTAAVEAAVGFTSGFEEEFSIWEMIRGAPARMRLGFMYQLDPKDAAQRGLVPVRSPDWQTMTLKFFADGIVGARTAAVSKPFDDTGGYGFFMRNEDELEHVIVGAHLAGWQAAIHAVGDRAISRVIAAFERAQALTPRNDARHRIEHYFCPPSGGLKAMRDVGAIVVSQPSFVSRMRRSILQAFGPDAEEKYPARSVVDAGVVYVGSSDAPTGHVSPWIGMANAVDRGAAEGEPIGLSEALSRRQAISSYVHGGAYAMRQEDWRGVLEPGMAADLIALDRDPFEASVNLRSVRVLMTMIRGAVEYDTLASRTSKSPADYA